jgi:hypothetical protein
MSSSEEKYHNIFTPDEVDDRVISIATEPKFGIGQRAILLKTEHGNVLWDMIAFLDEETIRRVCSVTFHPLLGWLCRCLPHCQQHRL